MSRDNHAAQLIAWIERHHGDDGLQFAGEQLVQIERAGSDAEIALWREVVRQLQKQQEGVRQDRSVENHIR